MRYIETLLNQQLSLKENLSQMEKENKVLKDEVNKRENYLQQKLQLEIDIKKIQREKLEQDTKIKALLDNEAVIIQSKIKESISIYAYL